MLTKILKKNLNSLFRRNIRKNETGFVYSLNQNSKKYQSDITVLSSERWKDYHQFCTTKYLKCVQ